MGELGVIGYRDFCGLVEADRLCGAVVVYGGCAMGYVPTGRVRMKGGEVWDEMAPDAQECGKSLLDRCVDAVEAGDPLWLMAFYYARVKSFRSGLHRRQLARDREKHVTRAGQPLAAAVRRADRRRRGVVLRRLRSTVAEETECLAMSVPNGVLTNKVLHPMLGGQSKYYSYPDSLAGAPDGGLKDRE